MRKSQNIQNIISSIVFFVIFALSCSCATAATKTETSMYSQTLSDFADNFFTEKMTEYHIPGAALVIVKDGTVIFSKGYGYANIEKNMPVDPGKTVFRVASVSKIFTVAGVMQLEETGLIDISRDVNMYLKGLQVKNDYDEPIRIQYLLTHTDGFETRDLATFVREPSSLPTLENVLKNDLNSPVQAPGSKITYGGYGTALAGYLISQVTSKPFEEYMNENIFKPLTMNDSTFYQILPDDIKENVATVYDYDGDADKYISAPFLYVTTAPTGALSTTPEDMGKFLIALLNGGSYGENRILQEETVEKMFNRQYSSHPSLPGVTYGFMEYSYNGQRALVRDGSGVGIRSRIFLLPEQNLGYFYVQNTRGDTIAEDFSDTFMNRLFPASDKGIMPNGAVDSKGLARYEGIYRPAQTAEHTLVKMEALAMGDLQIKNEKNGELTVTVLGDQDVYGGFPKESRWVEIEPLLFRRVDNERYMAFQKNERGEVVGLASASGYHGEFVKIPWYESSRVQTVLLIAHIAVFIAAIIISIIKLIRRKWSLLQIGGVISLLFVVGFSGAIYTLFLHRIAGFPAFAFGVPPAAQIMLTLLLAASALSIGFLIVLVKSWVSGEIGMSGKVFYSVVMLSFAGVVYWLNYWNLLGYKY
jgi:CubicO group peptidase (beta-lactamase class C family)